MQFEEFKKEVEALKYAELRENSQDYFEAVISSSGLPGLIPKLEAFFSAPYSLPWDSLAGQAQEAIKGRGGIGAGQTLYFLSRDNEIYFAMLWPWGGGKQITVKISRQSPKV